MRKSMVAIVGTALVSVATWGSTNPAYGQQEFRGDIPTRKRPVPELYAVIRVEGELKVMKRSESIAFRKNARDGFRIALRQYYDAKREATKRGDKLDVRRPTMPRIATLKSTFKSQKAAEAYRDTILKRVRERKAGKATVKTSLEPQKKLDAASPTSQLPPSDTERLE